MRWTAIAPVLAVALAACTSSDQPGAATSGAATTITAPTSATGSPASAPVTGAGPTSDASTVTATATSTPGATGAGSQPVDFGSTTATVTAADGTTCDLCLWLADTPDRRSRGLMSVTDLGPGDGMAFRYENPHTGTFWMKNTLLPLSIVFYSADGDHLDAFDMEPCVTPTCISYPTPDDFLVAVEVPQGDLGRLGLTPGSRLTLHGVPCVTSGA